MAAGDTEAEQVPVAILQLAIGLAVDQAHVTLGHPMPGIGFQTRIADRFNFGMGSEDTGNRHGRAAELVDLPA